MEIIMRKTFKKLILSTVAVTALGAGAMSAANAGVFVQGPAVYVPTCRLIQVPYVNPWTGWSYFVTRQICN
jgi:hypothetical protein